MQSRISPTDLVALLKQEPLQLIDVRSHGEYAAAHLPGAMNVPLDQVEARIADLPQDRKIVLVCQSGNRATMACELIQHTGRDLSILTGGTAAWMDAGLPVVRSTRTRWSVERQVRLTVGLLMLAGLALATAVNPSWITLPLVVSVGLVYAGLTDQCPMAMAFALMPWNKARVSAQACEGITS